MGQLNYPPEVSARILIDCIMQHEREHPDTRVVDISIVVSDEIDDWKSLIKVCFIIQAEFVKLEAVLTESCKALFLHVILDLKISNPFPNAKK